MMAANDSHFTSKETQVKFKLLDIIIKDISGILSEAGRRGAVKRIKKVLTRKIGCSEEVANSYLEEAMKRINNSQ